MDEAWVRRLERFSGRPRTALDTRPVVEELGQLSPPALAAARLVWARRAFNEQGSTQLATRLLALGGRVAPAEHAMAAALGRLLEDEERHADRCARVLHALGAEVPVAPARFAANVPGQPARPFLQLVLHGLVLSESVSAARFVRVLTATDLPAFHALVRGFLTDEVHHARLGWLLLPWARRWAEAEAGPLDGWLQQDLAAALATLDAMTGMGAAQGRVLPAPRPQPRPNPGVVEPAEDAAAFRTVLGRRLLPRLDAAGLPASAAWADVCRAQGRSGPVTPG